MFAFPVMVKACNATTAAASSIAANTNLAERYEAMKGRVLGSNTSSEQPQDASPSRGQTQAEKTSERSQEIRRLRLMAADAKQKALKLTEQAHRVEEKYDELAVSVVEASINAALGRTDAYPINAALGRTDAYPVLHERAAA